MNERFTEKVLRNLGSLYGSYGYSRYKMSKFEEYDLYARNKDFLISDSVITFTDTNGKLMALKPDVTLSIVKNSGDTENTLQKVYYNENVYRVTKGAQSFKEIAQTGLECLGNIDSYSICEVLTLAAESLRCISQDCILEISHLGILSSVLDAIGLENKDKATALKLIGEKNIHELSALCTDAGISDENLSVLKTLVCTTGTPKVVLPKVRMLLEDLVDVKLIDTLMEITDALEDTAGEFLRIDFSLVNDLRYYNAIVMKGFVGALPSAVLSGGQYDKLMQRLGRKTGAMGFAVYTDMLERLEKEENSLDVDIVLVYDQGASVAQISKQVKSLTAQGNRVLAQPNKPTGMRYGRLLKLQSSGVEVLEENA